MPPDPKSDPVNELIPLPPLPDAHRFGPEPVRLPDLQRYRDLTQASTDLPKHERQAPPPPHPLPMAVLCPKCRRVAAVMPSNRLDERPQRCNYCSSSLASPIFQSPEIAARITRRIHWAIDTWTYLCVATLAAGLQWLCAGPVMDWRGVVHVGTGVVLAMVLWAIPQFWWLWIVGYGLPMWMCTLWFGSNPFSFVTLGLLTLLTGLGLWAWSALRREMMGTLQ